MQKFVKEYDSKSLKRVPLSLSNSSMSPLSYRETAQTPVNDYSTASQKVISFNESSGGQTEDKLRLVSFDQGPTVDDASYIVDVSK